MEMSLPVPVLVYGNAPQHQQPWKDPWSWEKFLEPLKNAGFKPKPAVDTIDKVPYSEKSLVYRFKHSLDLQDFEIQKNLKKDTMAYDAENTAFKVEETKSKNYKSASNIKADRESTGSTWTVEMLERYFGRQDIIFVHPENRCGSESEVLEKILERVYFSVKAICGPPEATLEILGQLQELTSTESETKMILDAILQPLCVYKGLAVRSELTIKSKELPTNRYDFIMFCGDNPIGVVEAKRRGCLNDRSVAQLLVQLLLLSAVEPTWFHFGVLSDAYQFIFAGISQQKIVFFQTNEEHIEIETVQCDDNVASVAGTISWLVDLAIKSREKPIENFFYGNKACLKIQDSFLND